MNTFIVDFQVNIFYFKSKLRILSTFRFRKSNKYDAELKRSKLKIFIPNFRNYNFFYSKISISINCSKFY